jgi:hypothetical protein
MMCLTVQKSLDTAVTSDNILLLHVREWLKNGVAEFVAVIVTLRVYALDFSAW